MADTGIGQDYTARVTVKDSNGVLTNADAPPEVTFTDPLGGTYGPFTTVLTSTGRYAYTFAVPNDETLIGTWQEAASATLGGAGLEGAGFFTVGEAGSLELDERWGMTPELAGQLTGETLTATDLANAEDDLIDYLGWVPNPDEYPTVGGQQDWRARQFGRALAWQAAYRALTPSTVLDGRIDGVTSESLGDYSYSKDAAIASTTSSSPMIGPRARSLINRSGLALRLGRANAQAAGQPDAFQAQRAEEHA